MCVYIGLLMDHRIVLWSLITILTCHTINMTDVMVDQEIYILTQLKWQNLQISISDVSLASCWEEKEDEKKWRRFKVNNKMTINEKMSFERTEILISCPYPVFITYILFYDNDLSHHSLVSFKCNMPYIYIIWDNHICSNSKWIALRVFGTRQV